MVSFLFVSVFIQKTFFTLKMCGIYGLCDLGAHDGMISNGVIANECGFWKMDGHNPTEPKAKGERVK